MSAITLETLRADFEAAHVVYAMAVDGKPSKGIFGPDDWVKIMPFAFEGIESIKPLTDPIFAAAHTFIIARDYSLKAAMLYKLSDGAIDPRVRP